FSVVSLVYVHVCLTILFIQAEDDIRYRNVTGVQTCALPISHWIRATPSSLLQGEIFRAIMCCILPGIRFQGSTLPLVSWQADEGVCSVRRNPPLHARFVRECLSSLRLRHSILR